MTTTAQTITSRDTGCLTAVPANDEVPVELRALGRRSARPAQRSYRLSSRLPGLARSGKSTASKYLVETHGYQLVKFAGPLETCCGRLVLAKVT